MANKQKEVVVRFCSYCNSPMTRKREKDGDLESTLHYGRRKYCDKECFYKGSVGQRKDQVNYSTSHRRARIAHANTPCVKCGSEENLDVHHKDGDWHNNDLNNLESLCRSCHIKEHRGKTCTICDSKHKAHGYCEKHYQRYKKYGNPLITKVNQYSEPFLES